MNRVKDIEAKLSRAKVNAGAAKRIIRNAMWDKAHKKCDKESTKKLTEEKTKNSKREKKINVNKN